MDYFDLGRRVKELRRQQNMTQEELAEMLDVSRQAISKWELGDGYPEVEKLLLLSSRLNISLDRLMSTEFAQKPNLEGTHVTGTITITSPHENVIAARHKVMSSAKFAGGKLSPQYALFGAGRGTDLFGNQSTTFLGWYACKEDISKEIQEIHDALVSGMAVYTLKYSVKTKRRLFSIKIEEE